ncbi:MAG: tRNA (adenosine(37)-N6)-threonylcarbamoyltransferase complex transferase subunit TsaD [Patescibacteria group bacterium]
MIILAIETSCDDTGVAILEVSKTGDFKVLSNIVSSQIEIHKKYGGVYPMLAKREHQKNLVSALEKALEKAGLLNQNPKIKTQNENSKFKIINEILKREPGLYKKLISFLKKYENPNTCPEPSRRIDLISVTQGPGLEPCLWVGINFAKALSFFWDIPIIPVNHIESHILVNFLNQHPIRFPAVCLVVSGGHTQLILMKKPFDLTQGKLGSYKILGETRDDAAGECFDKCAKILGLGYPGGPIISELAGGRRASAKLPRPMINTKDFDFSFSGLKTAVLYHHRKQPVKIQKSKEYIIEMCAEIQQAIIDVLIKKTIKASKDYKAKTIILGGGVSANSELRLQFQSAVTRHCEEGKTRRSNLSLIFPPTNLSTDNALMTAIAGYFHRNKKIARSDFAKLKAESNLRIDK